MILQIQIVLKVATSKPVFINPLFVKIMCLMVGILTIVNPFFFCNTFQFQCFLDNFGFLVNFSKRNSKIFIFINIIFVAFMDNYFITP